MAAAAILLPACSSSIADLPNPIGLPAETPARPEAPPAYPAVHDMPPERSDTKLSPDERMRIERELATARDRAQGKQSAGRTPATTVPAQFTGSNRNP